ncbi:hypothetical protein HPB49_024538 [Dermacentor silvarum]|uniref:Uncharacterized protein n=1 Tax=Dermacentor silvarum TaxID=543639 RepID=A0ACB8D157_DERSI|nr:hypothetical protein HPB49_024538 [Dermacentor silvarum]
MTHYSFVACFYTTRRRQHGCSLADSKLWCAKCGALAERCPACEGWASVVACFRHKRPNGLVKHSVVLELLVQVYGMTESCCCVTSQPKKKELSVSADVGFPATNVAVKVGDGGGLRSARGTVARNTRLSGERGGKIRPPRRADAVSARQAAEPTFVTAQIQRQHEIRRRLLGMPLPIGTLRGTLLTTPVSALVNVPVGNLPRCYAAP